MEPKTSLKKFSIAIDYGLLPKDKSVAHTPGEMTDDYLNFAVSNVYGQGLEGQKRRIWGRIQRKLAAAVEAENDNPIVELELAEVDFIKEAFAKAKFPPQFSKYVTVLEDAINSL